ncbi:MAG: hypothetical protein IJX87_00370 [Clostridia bacterium]|nr:hypothetical protein [Clostridia bacterium]
MKKKLMAILASACVVATGAAVAMLPSPEAAVTADEGVAAKLDACVDIASDSWVSNGCGWRINRYIGRSISSETVGVTLGAYGWEDAKNALIWGGGGPSSQGFGSLYTGGDFAVSFWAETTVAYAVVLDNYTVAITPSEVRIGYNDRRGVFNDHMMDYHPLSWTDLYTGNELGGENDSTEAGWIASQSVSLSGIYKVEVAFGTTNGETTVVAKVNDTLVTGTSNHARITGYTAAIVSGGMKVYSQQAIDSVAKMDKAVASLDESVYTGEFKTQVDTAVAEAKTAIWAEETLTSAFVNEKVNPVLAIINEKKINGMLDSCVDIASDSWVSGGNGWRHARFGGRTITSDLIGIALPGYAGNLDAQNCLVWAGGGWPSHEGGRALYTGGDFAVSFAADVGGSRSGYGFAVVVDQFSLWVSSTAIKIGYDTQAGTFGDEMTDYTPQQWTTDLDILHGQGSSTAQWFVQETTSISGVVKIDAFVTTDDNGTTLLGVKVGDKVVTATTEMERVTGWHTAIVSWGGNIYSTKYLENKGVSVGTNVYSNLNAAINAAADGATVTLNDNLTENAVTVAEGKNVTVDLNGKNYTADSVAVNGNLTVGGGNVTADFNVAGALTINSGAYTAKETLFTVNGGTLVLNGGSFDQSFVYDAVAANNGLLANYVVANGAVTLTSGELATVAHANADRSIVRLVAGIDSLSYDAVGFEITYNGAVKEVTTTKAFDSFTYGSEKVLPTAWNAAYLFGYNLKAMPAGVTFTVRAFWTAKDTGAKVYGEAVEVAVDNIVLAA